MNTTTIKPDKPIRLEDSGSLPPLSDNGNQQQYVVVGKYIDDAEYARLDREFMTKQGSQLLIYFYSLLFNLIKIDFLLILIHYHEWTLGVS